MKCPALTLHSTQKNMDVGLIPGLHGGPVTNSAKRKPAHENGGWVTSLPTLRPPRRYPG